MTPTEPSASREEHAVTDDETWAMAEEESRGEMEDAIAAASCTGRDLDVAVARILGNQVREYQPWSAKEREDDFHRGDT